MARPDLVVIPCGGAKLGRPAPAGEMYIGGYHRLCQRYALTLTGGDRSRVLILSAKYGLLRLDDPVRPYELRMGRPGAVTVEEVRFQAGLLGFGELAGLRRVVALGGLDYTDICRAVWPATCETPMSGVGGIGKQMAWLKERVNVPT